MSHAPRLAPSASPQVRAIYERMMKLGLTPTSLAAAIGRNETYFRDLFQGRSSTPSIKYLPAIAEALQCEVSDLLEPGKAGGKPSAGGEAYELDEVALIGLYRLLNEEEKRHIMRTIIREAAQKS